ncbi:FecCD family ABC transporter permease [Marinibactrum halimedae]|nr:iron ABC transporter permease [Marinibactrum halimedae]
MGSFSGVMTVHFGDVCEAFKLLFFDDIGLGGAHVGNDRLNNGAGSNPTAQVISQLRWPRLVLAMSVGACLAVCGASLQGLFRNPLADPSLIGVSAGASIGAGLAIVVLETLFRSMSFSLPHWAVQHLVALCAFVGAGLVAWLIYIIATCRRADGLMGAAGGTSVTAMLLAGIAVASLAGAVSGVLTLIADDNELRRVSFWQMGSLETSGWGVSILAFVVSVIVCSLLTQQAKALDALALGEVEASHLGVNVARLKRRLVLLSAFGVGVSVALTGMIGFLGLVAPHGVRLLIGPNHRYLLPASALMGALLLVLSDILSRAVLSPLVIPVGMVTAVLGAPVFLWLVSRHPQRYGQ